MIKVSKAGRHLDITLTFGRHSNQPIPVDDLLKTDTPEAWSRLLADKNFANSLLTPVRHHLLDRVVGLAIESHNASAFFLSEQIRLIPPETINNWQTNGRLDQLIPRLTDSAVIFLAQRPQASVATIICLAEHAAYHDPSQEALANLLNGWSEKELEAWASQNQLRPLLGVLPTKYLLGLIKKTDLFDDEHFDGPADQLLERAIQSSKGHHFEAGIILDSIAWEWSAEYLEHLAAFDKLTEVLSLLSPVTVVGLAKVHHTLEYSPFSHMGGRDRFTLRLIALANQGVEEAKTGLRELTKLWDAAYIKHLEFYSLYEDILGLLK